jgi:hypothetical protein
MKVKSFVSKARIPFHPVMSFISIFSPFIHFLMTVFLTNFKYLNLVVQFFSLDLRFLFAFIADIHHLFNLNLIFHFKFNVIIKCWFTSIPF